MKKKSFLGFVFVFLFISTSCFAQLDNTYKDYLLDIIDETEEIMTEITNDIIVKNILAYSIILFGLLVAILQSVNKDNRKILGIMIICLGAGISALSTIDNSLVKYDLRDAQRAEAKVNKSLKEMKRVIKMWPEEEKRENIASMISMNYDNAYEIYSEYLDKKLLDTTTFLPSLISYAYAETQLPEWINGKVDNNYLYIVCSDEENTYESAYENAIKEGKNKIAQIIIEKLIGKMDETELVKFAFGLADKTQIEDSYNELTGDKIKVVLLMRISKTTLTAYTDTFQLKTQKLIPNIDKIKSDLTSIPKIRFDAINK